MDELFNAIKRLHRKDYVVTQEECQRLLEVLDEDSNETIDFGELLELASKSENPTSISLLPTHGIQQASSLVSMATTPLLLWRVRRVTLAVQRRGAKVFGRWCLLEGWRPSRMLAPTHKMRCIRNQPR